MDVWAVTVSIGIGIWAVASAYDAGVKEGFEDGKRIGRIESQSEELERSLRQLRESQWRRTGKSDFGPPTIKQEETQHGHQG